MIHSSRISGVMPSSMTFPSTNLSWKKLRIRGQTIDGAFAAGELDIALGLHSLSGAYGGYLIDGSRDMFAAKDAAVKAKASQSLGRWKGGYVVAWQAASRADGWNTLSVAVKENGRVKVSGTLANGTRVTANSRLLVGERRLSPSAGTKLLVGDSDCAIAVNWAKRGESVSCVLWLCADGAVLCEGMPGVAAAKAGRVEKGAPRPASLAVDADALAAALPGLRADLTFGGAAPRGLKLKHKADGTFSGSFKACIDAGARRPKDVTVKFAGVVVGGRGYGSAYVKRPAVGGLPLELAP